jgi:hypothetical protein
MEHSGISDTEGQLKLIPLAAQFFCSAAFVSVRKPGVEGCMSGVLAITYLGPPLIRTGAM